jgi:hypothetical protein
VRNSAGNGDMIAALLAAFDKCRFSAVFASFMAEPRRGADALCD